MSKRENFFLSGRELRVQPNADGSRSIVGLIPYNSPSAGMPWTETIAPGAFADALKPSADTLMLRDHDPSLLLGRVASRTLTLTDSPEGLRFICKLPNTTVAADLIESMSRKDINGVSFGMIVSDDVWADDGNGNLTRQIRSLELFEISVCSFAAYPDASAALRTVPKEFRPLLTRSKNPDGCECSCPECEDDDCENCSDPDCDDPDCDHDEDDDEEDRSSRLQWAERIMLQIEVARHS